VRDIYVRHRNDCRHASPNPKKPTRLPARLIFGCGCPIYARVQVLHSDPDVAPFQFNGSLSKLGVTNPRRTTLFQKCFQPAQPKKLFQ
jgi:hypothetical protein